MAVVAFAACFRNYKRAESQPQANLHSNKKLATSQKSTRKTSNPQTSHKLKTQGVNKPATRQARMSSQACGIWLVGDHFKVCGPLVWQLGVTLHCTIANKIKFAELHWNKPRTNELRSSGPLLSSLFSVCLAALAPSRNRKIGEQKRAFSSLLSLEWCQRLSLACSIDPNIASDRSSSSYSSSSSSSFALAHVQVLMRRVPPWNNCGPGLYPGSLRRCPSSILGSVLFRHCLFLALYSQKITLRSLGGALPKKVGH